MLPVATVTFGTPPADVTCLVETATIQHGRDDPTTQPEADAATFEIFGEIPPGVDIGTPARIDAQLGATSYPRFVGRVTDLTINWEAPDTPVAQIIAVGALARMGNSIIGKAGYPTELDGARANRAITESGAPTDAARTDPGTLKVCARDRDPQPALQIAHEAAEDGAGILWQAKDGVVLYADADHRDATTSGLDLDACTIPLEVAWQKNLEGLVNDLTITWGCEGAPPGTPVLVGSYASPTVGSAGSTFPITPPGGRLAQFIQPETEMSITHIRLQIMGTPGPGPVTVGIASAVGPTGPTWVASGTLNPETGQTVLDDRVVLPFNPTLHYYVAADGDVGTVNTIGLCNDWTLTLTNFVTNEGYLTGNPLIFGSTFGNTHASVRMVFEVLDAGE